MDSCSDKYAFSENDPGMDAYFQKLSGYIQDQICDRKHCPASDEELVGAAEENEQVF